MPLSSQSSSIGASHTPPQLSVGEKLGLFTKLVIAAPYVVFGFVYDVATLRQYNLQAFNTRLIKRGALFSRHLTIRQVHYMLRPTGETISRLCKKEGIRHEKVLLNDGDLKADEEYETGQRRFKPAILHFVDCAHAHAPEKEGDGNMSRRVRKILIYFHGGGYVFPMITGQVKFVRAVAQKLDSDAAILEYTLAPELKYPGQLAQATAAIRYLLSRQYDASQIILGGDSAGANLCLSVLAHLRSPNPLVQPLWKEEAVNSQDSSSSSLTSSTKKFRGALCISPRCANNYESPSFISNASKDIINGRSMRSFVTNWEPKRSEVWACPLAGDKAFWEDLRAERVLLTAGLDEVFVDDVVKFAAHIGAKEVGCDGSDNNGRLQLAVCPGEIHTQAVLDAGAGYMDGFMMNKIMAWLEGF